LSPNLAIIVDHRALQQTECSSVDVRHFRCSREINYLE